MYGDCRDRQRMFDELESMSPTKGGDGKGDKESRRKEGEKSIWGYVDRNSWGTDDYLHRVDREENPEYL